MKDNRNLAPNPLRGKRQPLMTTLDWNRPPGRQMLDRELPKGEFDTRDMLHKLLRQTRKQDRKNGCFRKTTAGVAAAILSVLRDPSSREEFFRLTGISPEKVRSDEECARFLAVGWMLGDWARMIDAITLERLALFERERQMARRLRGLGAPFKDDADRAAWKAAQHLLTADLVRTSTRYLGFVLERDFGVRAPRLIAAAVSDGFELTPRMTERQARYLCRWEQATPPKLLG
jgi:hypothetical protein